MSADGWFMMTSCPCAGHASAMKAKSTRPKNSPANSIPRFSNWLSCTKILRALKRVTSLMLSQGLSEQVVNNDVSDDECSCRDQNAEFIQCIHRNLGLPVFRIARCIAGPSTYSNRKSHSQTGERTSSSNHRLPRRRQHCPLPKCRLRLSCGTCHSESACVTK